MIRITEVAPRDGLQNEPTPIAVAQKVRLVELLHPTRVDEIEVSSFVSPKWVPQLADASEVFDAIAASKPEGMVYSALVPNQKGMDNALATNDRAGFKLIDKVTVFTSATEGFARKNTNATIAETIERFRPVVRAAQQNSLQTRAYISSVIKCPVDGDVEPAQVATVTQMLLDIGIDEIDPGDTIGAATPDNIGPMLEAVIETLGNDRMSDITLHLHDTFGLAAPCVRVALDLGIRSYDGSVAGLGGCPYASTPGKRAPGNIATEVLLNTIESAGYTTRVDRPALDRAAAFAASIVETTRA